MEFNSLIGQTSLRMQRIFHFFCKQTILQKVEDVQSIKIWHTSRDIQVSRSAEGCSGTVSRFHNGPTPEWSFNSVSFTRVVTASLNAGQHVTCITWTVGRRGRSKLPSRHPDRRLCVPMRNEQQQGTPTHRRPERYCVL